MTLEEIKTTVLYIQGLQALWKEDYNAEKIGDYTFGIVCRDYNTTDELWEVINELQFMPARTSRIASDAAAEEVLQHDLIATLFMLLQSTSSIASGQY